MTPSGVEPVQCDDCGSQPVLVRDAESDTDELFRLECDCDERMIDVTETVSSNSLMTPMTGKWCNFNYDSTMRYNDN